MSKHWNYLSRILPTGVLALKGWEGFLPYWCRWLYSTSASYKWCLRKRTTERRGRQNVCVWQTWQGYYLRVLSWSLLNITVFLSLKICLKKSEIWQKTFQYYCHAWQSSFAVLLPKFNNVSQSWRYRFRPHTGFRHFRYISNAHKIV